MQLLNPKANSNGPGPRSKPPRVVQDAAAIHATAADDASATTNHATAAALVRAKQVIREGGTRDEAAAAAREVVRGILKERRSGASSLTYRSSAPGLGAGAVTTTRASTAAPGGATLAVSGMTKKNDHVRPLIGSSGGFSSALRKLRKKGGRSTKTKGGKKEAARQPQAEEEEGEVNVAEVEATKVLTLVEGRHKPDQAIEAREDTDSHSRTSSGSGSSYDRATYGPASYASSGGEDEHYRSQSLSTVDYYSQQTSEASYGSPGRSLGDRDLVRQGVPYDQGDMPSIYMSDQDESDSVLESRNDMKDPRIIDILNLNSVMGAVDMAQLSDNAVGRQASLNTSKAGGSPRDTSRSRPHGEPEEAGVEEGGLFWRICCHAGLCGQENCTNSICSWGSDGDDNGNNDGGPRIDDKEVEYDGQYYTKWKVKADAVAVAVQGNEVTVGEGNAPALLPSNMQPGKSVSWANSLDELIGEGHQHQQQDANKAATPPLLSSGVVSALRSSLHCRSKSTTFGAQAASNEKAGGYAGNGSSVYSTSGSGTFGTSGSGSAGTAGAIPIRMKKVPRNTFARSTPLDAAVNSAEAMDHCPLPPNVKEPGSRMITSGNTNSFSQHQHQRQHSSRYGTAHAAARISGSDTSHHNLNWRGMVVDIVEEPTASLNPSSRSTGRNMSLSLPGSPLATPSAIGGSMMSSAALGGSFRGQAAPPVGPLGHDSWAAAPISPSGYDPLAYQLQNNVQDSSRPQGGKFENDQAAMSLHTQQSYFQVQAAAPLASLGYNPWANRVQNNVQRGGHPRGGQLQSNLASGMLPHTLQGEDQGGYFQGQPTTPMEPSDHDLWAQRFQNNIQHDGRPWGGQLQNNQTEEMSPHTLQGGGDRYIVNRPQGPRRIHCGTLPGSQGRYTMGAPSSNNEKDIAVVPSLNSNLSLVSKEELQDRYVGMEQLGKGEGKAYVNGANNSGGGGGNGTFGDDDNSSNGMKGDSSCAKESLALSMLMSEDSDLNVIRGEGADRYSDAGKAATQSKSG